MQVERPARRSNEDMTTMGTRLGGRVGLPTGGARWWVYLVSGAAWILVAWVVLRFNLHSVASVAVLAGVVILLAAAAEIWTATMVRDWRWLHITLGVIFLITAIVIFVHPGNTFV